MEFAPSKKILPIYLLLDVSASMCGASIASVNRAMHDIVPVLRKNGGDNPFVDLHVEVITFGQGARTLIPLGPVQDWNDIDANDGQTDLGAAFDLVKTRLGTLPTRVAMPLIVVLSDGQPTDNWQSAYSAFRACPWGKPGRTMIIGISVAGQAQALNDACDTVLEPTNSADIVNSLNYATVAVSKAMSSSVTGGVAALPPSPIGGAADVF
jgi:uncharacterized protein YegL